MKLRTRAWIATVAAVIVAGGTSAVVVDAALEARDTLDRLGSLDRVLKGISDLQGLAGSYAAHPGERIREQWSGVHASLARRLEVVTDEESRGTEETGRLRQNLRSAGRLFGELENVGRAPRGALPGAQERLRSVLLSQITITLQGMVDDVNRWESRVYRRLWDHFSRLAFASVVVALILVGIIVGSGLAMERGVLRPLERLEEGIEEIAHGDRTSRLGWSRSDEIGALAGAFDSMAAALEGEELRREETEAELRESEVRFRQIAENIDDVFWITTPGKGVMEYVSPAYAEIWGASPGELYDDAGRWLERIHPDDRSRVRRALPEQLEGTYEEEYRIVRPDGEIRWIWDRAFPVEDEDGHVHRIVGVAEDITGRKELEHRLRRSQKMEAVGRLAGGIAHDFNNLLTVIRSEAELLLMDLEAFPDLAEEVEVIRDTAERASDLTTQLLAFSRKQVLQPRVVDLNEIVEAMRALLRRVLGEDIRIVTRLEEALPPIRVDPGQMEHVLMNLAVNARDAMPEGGTLSVSTSVEEPGADDVAHRPEDAAGKVVRLDVEDTGVGMDEKTVAQIFDPFFTTREGSGGTGLGLATVYGTIHQSGGTVDVQSEPGEGTVFTIRFPPAEGAVESVRRPSEAEPVTGEISGRILVIEDDDTVRRVARRILSRVGMEVRTAGDAETGLEILDGTEGGIDIVLTDLILPGMGGRKLVELLRERYPDLPLVVMSGYAEGSPGSRGDLPPEIAFVQKPFSPEGLLSVIRERRAGRSAGE